MSAGQRCPALQRQKRWAVPLGRASQRYLGSVDSAAQRYLGSVDSAAQRYLGSVDSRTDPTFCFKKQSRYVSRKFEISMHDAIC